MPSKGTTTQRGYGSKHKRERAKWVPKVKAGIVNCWRCGTPIHPNQPWDLGHDDHDRSITIGPEHRGKECPAGGNRATAGRRTRPTRTPAPALAWFTPTPPPTQGGEVLGA
ncbi:HNH endonuclease [Mycobacterium phage MooMoo]|uniref:HNH endonuclease n=1 Tax=Mycobacterium phage MooMoo TaxID=2108127 RepID=A0A2P1JRH4_9CAUD|nr:HNH endonuclease [Mycobacterium phage MooMoo]AVO21702.1 HNH endonuclease [Mycobacterium phage MooMoo]